MSLAGLAKAQRLEYDVELCYLRDESPTTLELKEAPLISNWTVLIVNEYAALLGVVNEEKHQISRLIWLDRHFGWARTEERLYRLNRPADTTGQEEK